MGRLFQEFAVTIMTAILISGFVSLTLTPMMCSRFLRPRERRTTAASTAPSSGSGTCRCAAYERSLARGHAPQAGDAALSRWPILAGTLVPLRRRAQGLPAERGHRLPQRHHRGRRGAVVRRHGRAPAGGGGGAGAGSRTSRPSCPASAAAAADRRRATRAAFFMRLKPRGERAAHGRRGRRRLRGAAGAGARASAPSSINPPAINIGGRGASSLYQFTHAVGGPRRRSTRRRRSSRRRLRAGAAAARRQQRPADQQPRGAASIIDRDRAASLGLTPRAIEEALYSAYGARQVSTILAPNNQYYVLLELLPEFQRDPSALRSAPRAGARTAQLVPLSALARIETGRRAADGQPLRAAAVGDAVVQPRRGRGAERGGGGRGGRGRARRCRAPSSPTSPAPRRRSSRPRAAWLGC